MDREPMDRKLDEWLDRALGAYGRTEPRPGLEDRVVEQLRGRLQRPHWWTGWRQPVWLSACAVTVAVLLVVFLLRPARPPAPEVKKSSDQELLLGVDRLLNQEVPSALAPALVLTKEMVRK